MGSGSTALFMGFRCEALEKDEGNGHAAAKPGHKLRLRQHGGMSMLRRRIASALFIDYENIGRNALANAIPNWLGWLEEGEFDEDRRLRRFVEKRVYLNPNAEKHRQPFEQSGFEVVVCDRFTSLKNSADIRIALDMFELAHRDRKVKEFILFSSDSDFIPVIQKLAERKKEVAVIVDQARQGIYSAYRYQADTLIPLTNLLDAVNFQPPVRNFFGLKSKKPAERAIKSNHLQTPAAKTQPAQAQKKESPAKTDAPPPPQKTQSHLIDLAATRVIRLAAQTPKAFVGQRKIEAELRQIPGFTKTGPNRYFGTGSYQALMKEIEKRTGRISVTPATGAGIRVKYKPKEE
jgi:uncharacterized LabA/DUF88 family protein